MNEKRIPADVGWLVGRFQVHQLTEAHKELIQFVIDNHPKVVISLGLSPLLVSQNNPLDFEARKQMILKEFPNVSILYIKDINNDDVWSETLDGQIKDIVSPTQSVVLYGGRDSFISHYTGKYRTQELESSNYVSGTEHRRVVSKQTKASDDWRAGVVWASANKYTSVHPTVDVAIYDEHSDRLLLCRKPNRTLFQFVGGFADVKSVTYETDARREAQEETSLDVSNPVYIGSSLVDDWRYRHEKDKVKTLMFVAQYISGRPTPQDDIEELKWFDAQLDESEVEIHHRPLLKLFKAWYEKEGQV